MLTVYIIGEEGTPSAADCIYDVDTEFGRIRIPFDDADVMRKINKVAMEIDHGVFVDDITFRDRFGLNISHIDISTGLKAIILAIVFPDKPIWFAEAGLNVRDYAITNLTNGTIIIEYPNITFDGDESKPICCLFKNFGYEFTSLLRLNYFFMSEVTFDPDLSIPGIREVKV